MRSKWISVVVLIASIVNWSVPAFALRTKEAGEVEGTIAGLEEALRSGRPDKFVNEAIQVAGLIAPTVPVSPPAIGLEEGILKVPAVVEEPVYLRGREAIALLRGLLKDGQKAKIYLWDSEEWKTRSGSDPRRLAQIWREGQNLFWTEFWDKKRVWGEERLLAADTFLWVGEDGRVLLTRYRDDQVGRVTAKLKKKNGGFKIAVAAQLLAQPSLAQLWNRSTFIRSPSRLGVGAIVGRQEDQDVRYYSVATRSGDGRSIGAERVDVLGRFMPNARLESFEWQDIDGEFKLIHPAPKLPILTTAGLEERDFRGVISLPDTEGAYHTLEIEVRRAQGSQAYSIVLTPVVLPKMKFPKEENLHPLQMGALLDMAHQMAPQPLRSPEAPILTTVTDPAQAEAILKALATEVQRQMDEGQWKNPFGEEYGAFKLWVKQQYSAAGLEEEMTRRDFLKVGAGTAGLTALPGLIEAAAIPLREESIKEAKVALEPQKLTVTLPKALAQGRGVALVLVENDAHPKGPEKGVFYIQPRDPDGDWFFEVEGNAVTPTTRRTAAHQQFRAGHLWVLFFKDAKAVDAFRGKLRGISAHKPSAEPDTFLVQTNNRPELSILLKDKKFLEETGLLAIAIDAKKQALQLLPRSGLEETKQTDDPYLRLQRNGVIAVGNEHFTVTRVAEEGVQFVPRGAGGFPVGAPQFVDRAEATRKLLQKEWVFTPPLAGLEESAEEFLRRLELILKTAMSSADVHGISFESALADVLKHQKGPEKDKFTAAQVYGLFEAEPGYRVPAAEAGDIVTQIRDVIRSKSTGENPQPTTPLTVDDVFLTRQPEPVREFVRKVLNLAGLSTAGLEKGRHAVETARYELKEIQRRSPALVRLGPPIDFTYDEPGRMPTDGEWETLSDAGKGHVWMRWEEAPHMIAIYPAAPLEILPLSENSIKHALQVLILSYANLSAGQVAEEFLQGNQDIRAATRKIGVLALQARYVSGSGNEQRWARELLASLRVTAEFNLSPMTFLQLHKWFVHREFRRDVVNLIQRDTKLNAGQAEMIFDRALAMAQRVGLEEVAIAPSFIELKEELFLLPSATSVASNIGVIAGPEGGLPYGVALSRLQAKEEHPVPVAFVVETQEEFNALKELGFGESYIYKVGPSAQYLTREEAVEAATASLQMLWGVSKVELLGVTEGVSEALRVLLANLFGIKLSESDLKGWERFIQQASLAFQA